MKPPLSVEDVLSPQDQDQAQTWIERFFAYLNHTQEEKQNGKQSTRDSTQGGGGLEKP